MRTNPLCHRLGTALEKSPVSTVVVDDSPIATALNELVNAGSNDSDATAQSGASERAVGNQPPHGARANAHRLGSLFDGPQAT